MKQTCLKPQSTDWYRVDTRSPVFGFPFRTPRFAVHLPSSVNYPILNIIDRPSSLLEWYFINP